VARTRRDGASGRATRSRAPLPLVSQWSPLSPAYKFSSLLSWEGRLDVWDACLAPANIFLASSLRTRDAVGGDAFRWMVEMQTDWEEDRLTVRWVHQSMWWWLTDLSSYLSHPSNPTIQGTILSLQPNKKRPAQDVYLRIFAFENGYQRQTYICLDGRLSIYRGGFLDVFAPIN
jgi:hypothetical protein